MTQTILSNNIPSQKEFHQTHLAPYIFSPIYFHYGDIIYKTAISQINGSDYGVQGSCEYE